MKIGATAFRLSDKIFEELCLFLKHNSTGVQAIMNTLTYCYKKNDTKDSYREDIKILTNLYFREVR